MSMLARYILQIVGSLVFMFVLNASLTGVLLAVVPIISLGAVQYGRHTVLKIRLQNHVEFKTMLTKLYYPLEVHISSLISFDFAWIIIPKAMNLLYCQ